MQRDPDSYTMSFGEHLEELRRRIILALIAPVLLAIVAMVFGSQVLQFFLLPVEKALLESNLPARVQALSPPEVFVAYLKTAVIVAFFFSTPFVIWQAWKFVEPGLYHHERRFALLFIPASGVLTIVGALFLYYVVLPVTLAVLIQVPQALSLERPIRHEETIPAEERVEHSPLPEMVSLSYEPTEFPAGTYYYNTTLNMVAFKRPDGEVVYWEVSPGTVISQNFQLSTYLNFVFVFMLAFAITFQLPLVIVLLGMAGLVTIDALTRVRKYAILVSVVVAAVLTPPDPLSQMLMAVPLYLLYELSIVLLRFIPARPELEVDLDAES